MLVVPGDPQDVILFVISAVSIALYFARSAKYFSKSLKFIVFALKQIFEKYRQTLNNMLIVQYKLISMSYANVSLSHILKTTMSIGEWMHLHFRYNFMWLHTVRIFFKPLYFSSIITEYPLSWWSRNWLQNVEIVKS